MAWKDTDDWTHQSPEPAHRRSGLPDHRRIRPLRRRGAPRSRGRRVTHGGILRGPGLPYSPPAGAG